jgi:hypothetical protein
MMIDQADALHTLPKTIGPIEFFLKCNFISQSVILY